MSQFYLPLERPQQPFGAMQAVLGHPLEAALEAAVGASPSPLRTGGDGISVSPAPPQRFGGTSAQDGPLGGLIAQLMNMLQQFMSMLGFAGAQPPQGLQQPENLYNDATASSTGDPHLAFNGTQANGQTQSARFDSMVGHQDLVDSDSFAGGYQVSTQVTAPNANGITTNQSATITTNYGGTQVSLDRSGNASITNNGQPVAINAGQTLDLGNGQTVTKNNDGSLTVVNVNGQGGTINTTLKSNGTGVDLTTAAHDADLGGDILNPQPQPPGPVMYPGMRQPMFFM